MAKKESPSSSVPRFSLVNMMVNDIVVVHPLTYAKRVGGETPPDFSLLSYAYRFNTNQVLRIEENAALIRLAIEVLLPDPSIEASEKNTDEHILITRIECSFVFSIPEIQTLLVKNGEQSALPDSVQLSMVGVAYSTLRGILWSNLLGTHIGTLILPTVHPAVVLGRPVER